MHRTLILVASLSAASCTAEEGDENNRNRRAEVDSGDTGSVWDSTCDRYVECVAVTAPELLGEVAETYADGGTCWEQGRNLADTCETACDAGLEKMADIFPTVPECADPPEVDGCPFQDGEWTIGTTQDSNSCGNRSYAYDEEESDFTCLGERLGFFTMELPIWTAPLNCRLDVLGYTCDDQGSDWTIHAEGAFDPYQVSTAGTWSLAYDAGRGGEDCVYSGTFTAEFDG